MDETGSCAVWGCFFIAKDVFQQKADTHDARRLQSLKTMMGRQSAAVASTNHAIMCASIGMVGYPRSKIVGKRRAQRESHRATVRAVCRTLGIYPVTPMLARILAWDRRSIGQIFEKRQRERAGCRAPSVRVWESAGATASAVCRLPMFGHIPDVARRNA